jgi:hypothetical protein
MLHKRKMPNNDDRGKSSLDGEKVRLLRDKTKPTLHHTYPSLRLLDGETAQCAQSQ